MSPQHDGVEDQAEGGELVLLALPVCLADLSAHGGPQMEHGVLHVPGGHLGFVLVQVVDDVDQVVQAIAIGREVELGLRSVAAPASSVSPRSIAVRVLSYRK